MEHRRFGRTGHQSSVVVFGAAAVASSSPDETASVVASMRAAGVNHVDTAASYGEAEVNIAPHLPDWSPDLFLATKTTERTAEGAWRELNQSLERMGVDRVDLWQVHAVNSDDDLAAVFASGGPLPAFERAQREGLVEWVGITGHTEQAPRVHRAALDRHDFDTVLCPMNHQLHQDPRFADDFAALVEVVEQRDLGLRTIKAVARRPWREGEQNLKTWYQPLTDPEHVRAAVSWVLGTFPQITGIPSPSDPTLQDGVLQAEADRMDLDQANDVLAGLESYSSIFV